MAFYPSIQSLYSIHTKTAGTGYFSALDWAAGQLITCGTGSYGSQAMACLDITDSSEVAWAATTTGIGNVYPHPIAITPTNVFTPESLVGGIWQFDRTTLAQTIHGGSFSCFDGSMASILGTDGTYKILCTGPGFTATFYQNFAAYDAATCAVWTPGAISYNNEYGYACPGAHGTGIGYVISSGQSTQTGVSMRLFSADTNTVSYGYTSIGTIAPADVDATWGTVYLIGLCLDQTDNKLIVAVGNATLGAYKIIKVNPADASVVWATTCPKPTGGDQMSQSSIKHSRFGVISQLGGGVNQFTLINTTDGSIVTTYTDGLAGIVPFSSQCFNDDLGAFVGNYSYTAGAGAPTQRNATPSSFDTWAALYVSEGYTPINDVGPHRAFTRIWGNWR